MFDEVANFVPTSSGCVPFPLSLLQERPGPMASCEDHNGGRQLWIIPDLLFLHHNTGMEAWPTLPKYQHHLRWNRANSKCGTDSHKLPVYKAARPHAGAVKIWKKNQTMFGSNNFASKKDITLKVCLVTWPSSGRGNEKDVCESEKVLDWPLFSGLTHERYNTF